MDDVLLNKGAIMERCLRRVAEEYAGTPSRLLDPTHQDAIVLNLEKACQAAIDAAMYVVEKLNLEILQTIVESRGADFLAFCAALGLRIRT